MRWERGFELYPENGLVGKKISQVRDPGARFLSKLGDPGAVLFERMFQFTTLRSGRS